MSIWGMATGVLGGLSSQGNANQYVTTGQNYMDTNFIANEVSKVFWTNSLRTLDVVLAQPTALVGNLGKASNALWNQAIAGVSQPWISKALGGALGVGTLAVGAMALFKLGKFII